jgi:glucose dehydrogenase
MMRTLLLAGAFAALLPVAGFAQTALELENGANDTANVLNYGMGYSLQRYSPLTQINRQTARNLVPVWNYSYDDNHSEESQPLIYKGVLYVTTNSATMALNARSGEQIWKTKVEYPPEVPRIVCCGIINRGAALYEGKVFRTTLDADVIALDAATGKEIWRSKVIDYKAGYSQTVAPLIADGVVITGYPGRSTAYAASSTAGTQIPANICGERIPSQARTTRTARPGPGIHGSTVADPPGSPDHSIPSCTPSIGAQATPDRGIRRSIPATTSTHVRSSRLIRRPDR